MRHLRFIFTLFLFVVSHIVVDAQYLFRHIDTSLGLPDNETKALFWTPDGLLGVRTSSSLSLYDGCTFRSFAPNGDEAYSTDYVSPLTTAYVDNEKRVWMKELGKILVFDLTTENYIKDVRKLLTDMGVGERINNIFVDSDKDYWFVTAGRKLIHVSAKAIAKGKEKSLVCRYVKIRTNGLRDICRWANSIWLVYEDGWVIRLDQHSLHEMSRQRLWTQSIQKRDFIELRSDNNHLWLMWNHGVALLASAKGKWHKIFANDAYACVTMIPADGGSVYVGVRQLGLVRISADGSVSLQKEFPTTEGETVIDDIQALAYNKGNLMMGLYGKGICFYHPNIQRFPFLLFSNLNLHFNDYRISHTADGNVLLTATNDVFKINPTTMTFTRMPIDGDECIRSFEDSRHRLWTGTFRNGIYMKDGSATHHFTQGGQPSKDINYDIVRGFQEDHNHRIWISFHGGIGWFDEKTQRIVQLLDKRIAKCRVVNDFRVDKSNRLWVASDNGLFVYDQNHKRILTINDLTGNKEALLRLAGPCKALLIDSRGLVWVGTLNGIYIIDPIHRTARHIGTTEGMCNEMINGIIEDLSGNVWVTTPNGLCRFQHQKSGEWKIMVFDHQNKLNDCRFGWMTTGRMPDGRMLFGVSGGVYIVNPSQVKDMVYQGHPVLTALNINGEDIVPGHEYNGSIILRNALSATKRLTLSHNENFLTIMFSGLNFDMPNHTYYRYRLLGLNDRWIETYPKDGVGRAVFTDLAPGKYILEVYAAASNKQWSNEPIRLEIVVNPPLWATWWAKLLYVIVIVLIVSYGVRWKLNQNRRRMEAEKYRELEEMKYRFFTNISHEFRTLLTLIITPLGSILRRTEDDDMRSKLSAVNKNAGELLQLVNQLLDFRKMEMKGERLNLVGGNIDEFVEYTTQKFSPLSEQKGVALRFANNADGLFMLFDRDKMAKILGNLLSNAFKYTDAGGTVTVSLSTTIQDSRRYLQMTISDTGCGITEADRKHIFERFFRSEHQNTTNVGSGIGLNMVAEYVHMHEGKINVESQTGKGSNFIVLIPTDLTITTEPLSSAVSIVKHTNNSTVLIVEDNDEFRNFMAQELSAIYNKVLSARDGIEGALLAEEHTPDIIVSDVMMPRMNGVDMCRRIKENLTTSHIPVILLTAWSTDEARKEGYRAGADAYIAKPFDMEMLIVRINNLLEKQEKRQRDFSHNLSLDAKTITNSPQDEQFLQQVISCIEKNISNSEYTIDSLAHDMLMSRMSMYRKMKSLTGQTPADFIRTVRLKSAAKLLKSGQCNVSEACWNTGFASPQNFAKHFKEMFGVLPSQYS